MNMDDENIGSLGGTMNPESFLSNFRGSLHFGTPFFISVEEYNKQVLSSLLILYERTYTDRGPFEG